MTEDYKRGYLDALNYASGVALALERTARSEAEATTSKELRVEIETYIDELKNDSGPSFDAGRAHLLSAAPELLASLKHILAAIEQGLEINPGLILEYRFVVQRAEGKLGQL